MTTRDGQDPVERLLDSSRETRNRANRALGTHEDFVRLVMRYTSTIGALLGAGLLLLPMDPDTEDGWLLAAPFVYLADGGAEALVGIAFLAMVVSLVISIVTTLLLAWGQGPPRVAIISRAAPAVFAVCSAGLSLLFLGRLFIGEESHWMVPVSLLAAALMLFTVSCARHLENRS